MAVGGHVPVPALHAPNLTHVFSGANWGPLQGKARLDFTDDGSNWGEQSERVARR